MYFLTLNAGSSSIKYKVYNKTLSPELSGLIENIGEISGLWHQNSSKIEHEFQTHQEAYQALGIYLKKALSSKMLTGVGHRVVHGGVDYFKPTIITPIVLERIEALSNLAPIHNPLNCQGIHFAIEAFPQAIQVAVFDTGFHHTLPPKAHTYALPQEINTRYQIRRYGFHGINHEYVAEQAAKFLKKPLNDCNFITLHLGNGASACLIKNGRSVDTSMGMTPLAGLVMGTRTGDIDPAIPLYLQTKGYSAQEVDTLMNKQSGLLGIGRNNDMRKLCEAMQNGDVQAELAVDLFVYSIQKTIGAYLSQTPHLDALVFTGGIGENAMLVRSKIIEPLRHFGLTLDPFKNNQSSEASCHDIAHHGTPVLIIKGDEELFIAHCVQEKITTLQ